MLAERELRSFGMVVELGSGLVAAEDQGKERGPCSPWRLVCDP